MKLSDLSCRDFTVELSSKKPVPGGGGTAALVSALGVSLNTMVANFTIGKKKYQNYEKQYDDIIKRGEKLRNDLIYLIDKDAENFEPLSRAYSMPYNTEEEKKLKDEMLEKCLKMACNAPVEIIEFSYDAIILHRELVDISSKIMISDIGVGVQCLKAALNSAYLNVLINVNLIEDEIFVKELKERIENKIIKGTQTADEVYEKVINIMNNKN
ncbi:MAG: cyclodeaminase/cyclohydrolase family protein [Tissierellia bacterium]|nr:cyclodeaminase/cyclohydrolase family protein [Tissierellia bacterium]MDD4780400.1 cyclodeaminase/cyclohydrolase family protein [Tissierellia bacterium]